MFILITYDINTQSTSAQKRLRQVAKVCESYGQRVQNSVFECSVDYVTYLKIEEAITNIIDTSVDSVRFYNMGKNGRSKIKHIGIKPSIDIDKGNLIF